VKVLNKSRFDTRFLYRLVVLVHNRLSQTEGRLPQWKGLEVTVETGRSKWGCVRGHARYHGTHVHLFIPKNTDTENVIWLIAHELHHSYGYRHGHFLDWPHSDCQALVTQHGLPQKVLLKAVRPKLPRNLRQERLERVKVLLTRWERVQKRAAGRVAHYRRKLRYYEKTENVARGLLVESVQKDVDKSLGRV
jgi:uncharacterized protein YjaZ